MFFSSSHIYTHFTIMLHFLKTSSSSKVKRKKMSSLSMSSSAVIPSLVRQILQRSCVLQLKQLRPVSLNLKQFSWYIFNHFCTKFELQSWTWQILSFKYSCIPATLHPLMMFYRFSLWLLFQQLNIFIWAKFWIQKVPSVKLSDQFEKLSWIWQFGSITTSQLNIILQKLDEC